MSSTPSSSPVSSRALTVSSMPGVQKPHWSAAWRVKAASSRSNSGRSARPSIVVTSFPAASTARKQHELTGSPSSRTVHAPQTCTSQERFAPVSASSSRRKSSSSSFGATSLTTSRPLTLSAISTQPSARARDTPLPRGPILEDEFVPILDREELKRERRLDRTLRSERRRDRLQLHGALERHRGEHRPRHVLPDN